MNWPDKVRQLVGELGTTYRRVEELAGWPRNTLCCAVKAGAALGVSKALGLARALGVSVEWLFDDQRPWDERAHNTPRFTVHGIAEMPPQNQTQRWCRMDYEAAWKALSGGKSISLRADRNEVATARNFMYSGFGRFGRVETHYDGATERLWVCRKGARGDYHMSLPEHVHNGKAATLQTESAGAAGQKGKR